MLAVDIKRDVINPWAVIIVQLYTAELFQLSIATLSFYDCLYRPSTRHSRRPEAITAEVPIWRLLDVLSKATVL